MLASKLPPLAVNDAQDQQKWTCSPSSQSAFVACIHLHWCSGWWAEGFEALGTWFAWLQPEQPQQRQGRDLRVILTGFREALFTLFFFPFFWLGYQKPCGGVGFEAEILVGSLRPSWWAAELASSQEHATNLSFSLRRRCSSCNEGEAKATWIFTLHNISSWLGDPACPTPAHPNLSWCFRPRGLWLIGRL